MLYMLRRFLGQSCCKHGHCSRTLYLRTSWMLMRDNQIEGSFPHVRRYLAGKEKAHA